VLNLLRGLAVIGLLSAVLFGSAGRWDLPFFWAYVGVNAALTLMGVFTVDPNLQQERWHPAARNKEFWGVVLVVLPCFLAHLVLAGLDVGRFHWPDRMPPSVQIAGLGMLAASWGLTLWAMIANPFFSPVVRIQTERGHHLIAAGPYRYVRHPGYAGAIVGILSSPLALGSWWALVPVIPIVLLVIRRTAWEDRFLHQELPGYAAYAAQVRYRLLDRLWF
jgi:protein-S-isoprenylcysteine O-methyltransferase Ste14